MFLRIFSFLFSICLLVSTAGAETPAPESSAKPSASEPSSAIPDKREFPLNEKIKPCDDFHAYVCSKAEAAFKLREDRSIHQFAFSDSRERLLEAKKKFMKELPEKKGLNSRTEQIRDFYMACMDEKNSALSEKKEVAARVKEIEKISSAKALVKDANKHQPEALSPLIGVGSEPNPDDPLKLDAILHADFMLLPDHKYYENADLMADYQKLVVLFFKNVFPKISDKEAETRAQNLITLQKDFIKVYPIANVRRKRWSEKHISTQAEIEKKYPELQTPMILKKMPKSTLVTTPIYEGLEFLNDNLGKYPLQTWKDMYLFKNLQNVLDDAYPDFFNTAFAFQKKYFGGPNVRPERQERCTTSAAGYFMKELDAAMLDGLFPHFDESKVQDVANHIRASILDGLNKNTWLSAEGKQGALNKIKLARLQLVQPHTDKEWDFNEQRKYSKTDTVKNMHTFREANWDKTLKELPLPANQDSWGMGPLTVNAYYSESENKFVVPIGILQYPFYDKDGSLLENLGAVGSVMGHELGHSIDDNGSKYDATGKLNPWMNEKDHAQFDTRAEKLIHQFDAAGHDGKLTLGENIGDLVGVTFAYNAAFPDGKGSDEDKRKFFTSYARLWCGVVRPEFDALRRKTDPHANGWFRINEQVKQQPGFAEAFSCKSSDKMVLPESERVKIW